MPIGFSLVPFQSGSRQCGVNPCLDDQLRELVRQVANTALEEYITEHLPGENEGLLQAPLKLTLTLSEVRCHLLLQWFQARYGKPVGNEVELKEALGELLYRGLDLALSEQLGFIGIVN